MENAVQELIEIGERCWRSGNRVVLCHGCFDILHVGHIRHLQAAKELGDVLVVTVTADEFVNKGPDRPIFSVALRVEALRALRCVDFAFPNYAPTAVNVIGTLKPRIYCKGGDNRSNYTANFREESAAIRLVGGELVFTGDAEFHATDIIEKVVCCE